MTAANFDTGSTLSPLLQPWYGVGKQTAQTMVDEQDVLDFATEMGLEVVSEGILKTLIKGAVRYSRRNTEAFLEVGRREDRDREIRTTRGILARLSVLEQEAEDKSALLAGIQTMVDDHQFWRLQANLRYEALRESLDSRKEMLEAAAVGLADPDMSIELKARLERTLRELDPQDIALLRSDLMIHDSEDSMSLLALMKTRCIVEGTDEFDFTDGGGILQRDDSGVAELLFGKPYRKTTLGKAVVRVLETYKVPDLPKDDD